MRGRGRYIVVASEVGGSSPNQILQLGSMLEQEEAMEVDPWKPAPK